MIEKIIPKVAKDKIKSEFISRIKKKRRKKEDNIPSVSLEERHIEGCELVLNRMELISNLESSAKVAEIGVDKGDFSSEILSETDPIKLHLVDVWGSKRYGEEKYRKVIEKFERKIEKGVVNIHRSRSENAVNEFRDGYFSWVYIDTSH